MLEIPFTCGITKKSTAHSKIIFALIYSAHATLHVFVVFIKQMELVDKPGSKLAVWKFFGIKCDEEERPIIDGHAFCRQCKAKVAARSGNTSNLIVHLRNNHPTIYADFVKQKAEKEKAKPDQSKKSATQKSITEALISSQPYDHKSKKWMELTKSVTYCVAKDMLPMYSVEKPGFRRMLATFDKRYEPPS